MNGTKLIGSHLLKYSQNLKLKIYDVNTICAFTNEHIEKGIKLSDLIKEKFVDFNPFEKEIIRPIPINSIKNNTIETFDLNKVKIVSIRRLPPYHSSINKEKCFVI